MSSLGQGLLFIIPTFVNPKVCVIKCPGFCLLVCFQVFFVFFINTVQSGHVLALVVSLLVIIFKINKKN